MKNSKIFVVIGCLAAAILTCTVSGCDPMANCGDSAPEPEFFQGQITGFDASLCACCGGWFLKTTDTTFLFVDLPAGTSLDLNNATFPIPVKFAYEPDTTGCGSMMNRIILTEIELL